jgi:hypothetical protein
VCARRARDTGDQAQKPRGRGRPRAQRPARCPAPAAIVYCAGSFVRARRSRPRAAKRSAASAADGTSIMMPTSSSSGPPSRVGASSSTAARRRYSSSVADHRGTSP